MADPRAEHRTRVSGNFRLRNGVVDGIRDCQVILGKEPVSVILLRLFMEIRSIEDMQGIVRYLLGSMGCQEQTDRSHLAGQRTLVRILYDDHHVAIPLNIVQRRLLYQAVRLDPFSPDYESLVIANACFGQE